MGLCSNIHTRTTKLKCNFNFPDENVFVINREVKVCTELHRRSKIFLIHLEFGKIYATEHNIFSVVRKAVDGKRNRSLRKIHKSFQLKGFHVNTKFRAFHFLKRNGLRK